LLILWNSIIVNNINNHINITITNAPWMSILVKNTVDQIKFNNNWTAKNVNARDFLIGLSDFRNIQNDAKIIKYKIIQTGANSQFGGIKAGVINELYQSELYIVTFKISYEKFSIVQRGYFISLVK